LHPLKDLSSAEVCKKFEQWRVGFEDLTAVSTNMAVFWVVVWQKFTNVSEVLAASIIRAMRRW
jgi:hypothetical protein